MKLKTTYFLKIPGIPDKLLLLQEI